MTTIGESGSGKTTWAFFQAIQVSKKYKVLFVSLEMKAERVIELRSRKMAGITTEEWNDKIIPEYKINLMNKYKKEITDNKNLEIVGVNIKAEAVTVGCVIESLLKKYMEYDYIVIDNLGFIQ